VRPGITVGGDRAPGVFAKSKSEDPVNQQFAAGDLEHCAGNVRAGHMKDGRVPDIGDRPEPPGREVRADLRTDSSTVAAGRTSQKSVSMNPGCESAPKWDPGAVSFNSLIYYEESVPRGGEPTNSSAISDY
jgi:hypothetical protein